MPFGLQPIHLVVIAVVALLIFGPRRLPEIGRSVGKAITEFRKGAQEMTESFREEVSKPADSAGAPTTPSEPSAPTDSVPTSARPAAGKYCSKCGAANGADARFCSRCGAELTA